MCLEGTSLIHTSPSASFGLLAFSSRAGRVQGLVIWAVLGEAGCAERRVVRAARSRHGSCRGWVLRFHRAVSMWTSGAAGRVRRALLAVIVGGAPLVIVTQPLAV